jgi:hypothetical protein
MAAEPDNLVLELLRQMRAEMTDMRSEMARKSDLADLRSELKSDIADLRSDMLTMQARNDAEHKATREQVAGLRRAVVEYHSAVVGHGVIISDLEARMRRVEQHLKLEPTI